MKLDYRRKPPERQRWLTRTEFIIVLTGAAVLTAILVVFAWYLYDALTPFVPF
jgi:hypothetical protein